jgi:hypothetical protein
MIPRARNGAGQVASARRRAKGNGETHHMGDATGSLHHGGHADLAFQAHQLDDGGQQGVMTAAPRTRGT